MSKLWYEVWGGRNIIQECETEKEALDLIDECVRLGWNRNELFIDVVEEEGGGDVLVVTEPKSSRLVNATVTYLIAPAPRIFYAPLLDNSSES